MKATWSDNEDNNSKEDEDGRNGKFMPNGKRGWTLKWWRKWGNKKTLLELHDAFDDLYDEFKKLGFKYVALKRSSNELDMELNALRKEKIALFEENLLLKKEVEKFSNIVYNLTNGK